MSASGYRNYTSGTLTSVGTEVNVNSSSPYASGNIYAGILWATSSNMNPLNNGSRGNARTVRCVQHLQAAFYQGEN